MFDFKWIYTIYLNYWESIDILGINKYNLGKIMDMYDMHGGVWCENRRN